MNKQIKPIAVWPALTLKVVNKLTTKYDDAGNMTTLRSGDTTVYDGWNRLVEVDWNPLST